MKYKMIAGVVGAVMMSIYGVQGAQPVVSPPCKGLDELRKMKVGFFVHYVWAGDYGHITVDKAGKPPVSFKELAKDFDAEGFAADLAAWQVEYVIFTAWHANINPLFPSKTMKKWGLGKHVCERDLLGDMIKAVKPYGIKVLLYTHPRDGHDLRGEDQVKTGWGPNDGKPDPDWPKFDFKKWNDFTNDLYGELVDRYGKDIVGLYLDEGSGRGDSHRVVDYPRLRQTIKSRNPDLVMIQNYYGTVYSCDIGDKEYCHSNEFKSRDGNAWPTWKWPVATCFASGFWTKQPVGTNTVVFSVEDMFRYTVLEAGANTVGGGLQWSSGPYPGGGWETGVDETMRKLGSYIKPIAESIKGVYASKAYLTPEGMTLGTIQWGVATDAADGTATFLHVLKAPDGKTLKIGKAADGTIFTGASLLVSGKPLGFKADEAGYQITLPDDIAWDKLDTVIRLQK
jgi:hypothetical protein